MLQELELKEILLFLKCNPHNNWNFIPVFLMQKEPKNALRLLKPKRQNFRSLISPKSCIFFIFFPLKEENLEARSFSYLNISSLTALGAEKAHSQQEFSSGIHMDPSESHLAVRRKGTKCKSSALKSQLPAQEIGI